MLLPAVYTRATSFNHESFHLVEFYSSYPFRSKGFLSIWCLRLQDYGRKASCLIGFAHTPVSVCLKFGAIGSLRSSSLVKFRCDMHPGSGRQGEVYVHQSTSLLSGLFSATLGLQKVGRPSPRRRRRRRAVPSLGQALPSLSSSGES